MEMYPLKILLAQFLNAKTADASTVPKFFQPILVSGDIITAFGPQLVIIGSSSLSLALVEAHSHHSTPN